MKMIQTSYNTI